MIFYPMWDNASERVRRLHKAGILVIEAPTAFAYDWRTVPSSTADAVLNFYSEHLSDNFWALYNDGSVRRVSYEALDIGD